MRRQYDDPREPIKKEEEFHRKNSRLKVVVLLQPTPDLSVKSSLEKRNVLNEFK